MIKTIIVTGSSGEIGTAICKKLIETKYFCYYFNFIHNYVFITNIFKIKNLL